MYLNNEVYVMQLMHGPNHPTYPLEQYSDECSMTSVAHCEIISDHLGPTFKKIINIDNVNRYIEYSLYILKFVFFTQIVLRLIF